MLQTIQASKLYRASKYKQEITEAYKNPINKELVYQLERYISDETIEELDKLHEEHHEDEEHVVDDVDKDDDLADDKEQADTDTEGDVADDATASISTSKLDDVKASIEISEDPLLGLLNSREETKGAIRVVNKDDEIWIHYSDDINLNNVMESVISLLFAADYRQLSFNRLARSNNAIVFTVSQSTSTTEEGQTNE